MDGESFREDKILVMGPFRKRESVRMKKSLQM